MFFTKAHIQVKGNNERVYELSCPSDAPLGELHDALLTMRAYVLQQMNEQAVKEMPKQEEEDATQKQASEESSRDQEKEEKQEGE